MEIPGDAVMGKGNSRLRSVANADGAAILDTEAGQITTLNSTGALVWKALERGARRRDHRGERGLRDRSADRRREERHAGLHRCIEKAQPVVSLIWECYGYAGTRFWNARISSGNCSAGVARRTCTCFCGALSFAARSYSLNAASGTGTAESDQSYLGSDGIHSGCMRGASWSFTLRGG